MSLPFLSLKTISIDPRLVRQIPAHLAYYHVVIPVAIDEDQVTLVMAYADNRKVIDIFEALFGLRVVPVQGDLREIRASLDQIYPQRAAQSAINVVSWSSDAPQMVQEFASAIAQVLAPEAMSLPLNATHLEGAVQLIEDGSSTLAVIELPSEDDLETLLRTVNTSLLMIRRKPASFQRVLLILQGHSPDGYSIALSAKVAGAFGGSVTLLKVAAPQPGRTGRGIATLLDQRHAAGQQLATCMQQIQAARVPACLKLRQGNPETETVTEFLEGDYDLIAIAVEAYGAFITRILKRIQALVPERAPSLLAVKPQQ